MHAIAIHFTFICRILCRTKRKDITFYEHLNVDWLIISNFVNLYSFRYSNSKRIRRNKRMKRTNMECNVTNYFKLHSKMCNCFGYIVTYNCVVGVRINTMHFNSWITFVIISFWILTLFYLLLIDLFQFLMNNMNKWNDNKGESEKSNKNNNWCFWYKLQIHHIILLRNYLCAKKS